MNIADRFVDGREKGSVVPISIGTAIAVETALGVSPDNPMDRAPILEVKLLVINIRTLIRNLIGAMPTDARRIVNDKNVLPALVEELNIIEAAVSKQTEGRTRVLFYACSYQSLKAKFPNALLKTANTEIQIFNQAVENGLVNRLKSLGTSHDIRYFDVTLEGKFPDAFIITHSAVDLLSVDSFSKLTLLESHTGALKKHLLWNTKLTNGKDMPNMPFCRLTLQVFGDGGSQFSPQSLKVKQALKNIADEYKWTSFTTRDKMVFGIGKIQDKMIRSTLQGLM